MKLGTLGSIGFFLLVFCSGNCAAEVMRVETPAMGGEITSCRSQDGGVKLRILMSTQLAFSDNVFALSESEKSMLADKDPEDVDSGRLKDMESGEDMLFTPRMGLKMRTRLFSGMESSVATWIAYHAYARNTARSYPEFELDTGQKIMKDGTLKLRCRYVDGYFRKNYLSGAVDDNGNGNISKDERIYSQGIYDEYEGILELEQNLMRAQAPTVLSKLALAPFGGFRRRSYDSPFDNRDKQTLLGGLKIHLALFSRLNFQLAYTYEDVRSSSDDEQVLFDETRLGMDVNDDGLIRQNALLVTRIDRSCNRHTAELDASTELGNGWSCFMTYAWRKTAYESGNPLDVDHYDQTGTRNKFSAGVICDIAKRWTVDATYKRTVEDADEDDDYTENKIALTLTYDFRP